MKARRRKRARLAAVTLLAVTLLTAAPGLALRHACTDVRRQDAERMLAFYQKSIPLALRHRLNYARELALVAAACPDNPDAFARTARELLKREGVRYVCLIRGDTVRAAFPEAVYGADVGKTLRDFSYVYSLAQVVGELVVEGPMDLRHNGEQGFFFVQPLPGPGHSPGEVVVALDRAHVLDQLDFGRLHDQGYDYELWRVNPQTGAKDVVAASGPGRDFSYAPRITLYLPTQWTMSVQPARGWVTSGESLLMFGAAALFAALLCALAGLGTCTAVLGARLRRLSDQDQKTGLLNRSGFLSALDAWIRTDPAPFGLLYFAMDDYVRLGHSLDEGQKNEFLRHAADALRSAVAGKYLAGRVGEGHFALAVREDAEEEGLTALGRAVALDLLWKTSRDGRKIFLRARPLVVRFPRDGSDAAALLQTAARCWYETSDAETGPDTKRASA